MAAGTFAVEFAVEFALVVVVVVDAVALAVEEEEGEEEKERETMEAAIEPRVLVVVEFLVGSLPWMGTAAKEDTDAEGYSRVAP